MTKKKDEKKVVPIAPTVEIPEPQGPTPEEIAEQMRRDEEEMDRRLNRYLAANPMPPTSGVEEQEDEEEETFTLDFDKGIATQKIGEGVAIRNEDGTIEVIEGPVADKIKEVAAPVEVSPYDKEKNRFQDMITERMVSKALASIMVRLNQAQLDADKAVRESGLGFMSDKTAQAVWETIDKQKRELKQAWHGGVVAYDKIPAWAMPWVEDYIRNGLNTLLDFVERD
jgi:hypothetical protein